MSRSTIEGFRIAGVATCLPPKIADNLDPSSGFDAEEVRKVVAMAGVRQRRVVDPGVTASDLSFEAAEQLLERLGWARDSITGLITQSCKGFPECYDNTSAADEDFLITVTAEADGGGRLDRNFLLRVRRNN